jgi:membrane protease YdiL (CAAX protease family)
MKGWQRILILILPYFTVIGIFQLVGMLLTGVDYKAYSTLTTQQHLIISIFNLLGHLILVWFFMKEIDNEPFISIGLEVKNRKKDIICGFITGLFIMCFAYAFLITINELYYFKINFSIIEIICSILVFAIVAFVEEMLLRGYVLRNLMYSFNKYVALIVSSLLFSLMHGFNPNMDWFSFLNLFLAGIVLGASYIYNKNLWFPIALHFSWNLFQTLFGFNVSGQDFYSLIEFKITDKNILNGGDFGFEGSIFSIIAQVLLIVTIWYYYERIKPKNLQN